MAWGLFDFGVWVSYSERVAYGVSIIRRSTIPVLQ
jgi:hypothetical protein